MSLSPVCPALSSTPLSLPAAIGACLEDAYSNAGGGGERVLWTAVALMQRTEPDVISVVYSGDTDASKEQIIAKAKVRARAFPLRCNARTTCPYPTCMRRPGLISRSTRTRFILSSSSRGGSSRTAHGRGSHSSGRAWAPCTSHGRRCPSSSQTSISVRQLTSFLLSERFSIFRLAQIRWDMLLRFTSRGLLASPLAHTCTILPLVPICSRASRLAGPRTPIRTQSHLLQL